MHLHRGENIIHRVLKLEDLQGNPVESVSYTHLDVYKRQHLTGANCGYGGTGPHKTAQILMLAVLDSSTAENIVQAPTLEIQFDSQGNIQTTNTFHNLFFSSQPEYQNRCAVFLDEYTFLQSEAKKLYFVNPQIHNIQGLFNAIDVYKRQPPKRKRRN